MMDASWTYCDNHFTIYVNQTIMLYDLDLYSEICQLFLSKTGKKIKYCLQLEVIQKLRKKNEIAFWHLYCKNQHTINESWEMRISFKDRELLLANKNWLLLIEDVNIPEEKEINLPGGWS